MSEIPSTPSTPAAAPSASAITPEVVQPNTNEPGPHAEGGTELAKESSPEAKKAPTEQEIKAAIKKWKLKSQGKEREVTDESELVRLANMGLGAHEKFEQAAKTRKQAESVLELLQKDPAKALASLGLDVRKLAEDFIVEEANKKMMSPEERQKFEIQQEIQRLKAEKDSMIKEQQNAQLEKLTAKYESDIQDEIITAIDKYKLPKNPKTVARLADYMAAALSNGYEASALDVALRVRQDLEEEHKALYSQYSVEDLLKIIGEDKLKQIRQYEVNKVKAKASPSPINTPAVAAPKTADSEDKPKKRQTMDEFQKELMDKYLK